MNGNVAAIIAAFITGERWMAKDTDQNPRDEIAQLAYHLYEVRGRQHGHDIEDWLRAEERLGACCQTRAGALTRKP
jgi:hypothetical protein